MTDRSWRSRVAQMPVHRGAQARPLPVSEVADATRQGGGFFDDMDVGDDAATTMTLALDAYARSRAKDLLRRCLPMVAPARASWCRPCS